MNSIYDKSFKHMIVTLICVQNKSTIKTAAEFNVPLKTVEKWVTAYNKDNNIFDENYVSPAQTIQKLKKEINDLHKQIDILKKTILVLSQKQ